jgi:hypothetical protein
VFLGTASFIISTLPEVSESVRTYVTSQLVITLGSIRHRRGRFLQHITFRNTGSTIPGPLVFVLDYLSSRAKVVNAAGVTHNIAPLGSPFILADLGPSGQLAGGASVSVELVFSARSARTIRYAPRVLAGLSQP